jgi:hypothetical protein
MDRMSRFIDDEPFVDWRLSQFFFAHRFGPPLGSPHFGMSRASIISSANAWPIQLRQAQLSSPPARPSLPWIAPNSNDYMITCIPEYVISFSVLARG